MKVIVGLIRHHALKAAIPVVLVSMVANDVRGRSRALDLGSTGGLIAALVLFAVAFWHARKADLCERCVPRPPAALGRLPFRAWKRFSDWGPIPALVTIIAIVLLIPIVFDRGPDRKLEFNWGPSISIMAMFVVFALHVATVRFHRVNYPGPEIRNPIRSFIDGQGRGQWLRHNGHWVVVGMIVCASVLSFFDMDGFWGTLQSVAFLGFLLAVYANHRHSMSLCEQCVTEFRTDAPEYAAQRNWRFMVAHRFAWSTTVATLTFMTLDTFVGAPYDMYFFPANFTFIGLFVLLERFHCSYQPWCPYCHGGGGGGGHEEVAPDPSGGHGRPLPVS